MTKTYLYNFDTCLTIAESLQSCGAANTIVYMRTVDSLKTTRQEPAPLPYKLS